jgi:uncharacterized protein (DUF1501 family)
MDRRIFLKNSLLFGASSALLPWSSNLSLAWAAGARDTEAPILVVIFLRGAMDGLSMLPPVQDPDYFLSRPNIRIPASGEGAALLLKNGFAVHPALSKVHKFANEGSAVFLFGAGSPAQTRSHFDAQDWMEAGVTGPSSLDSGFLSRISQSITQVPNAPEVVAIQNGLPRSLRGAHGALVFPNFKATHIQGPLTRDKLSGRLDPEIHQQLDPAFDHLYLESKDQLFHSAASPIAGGLPAFVRAEDELQKIESTIPKGPLSKSLGHVLALVRARSGVRLAVTEMGGWDTHVNQGNAEKGSLKDRLSELDEAIGFFWESLGADRERVCVVAMTEFGRTVRENGDRGTDHGHGSTFIVLGTNVNRSGVLHNFKGLRKDLLFEERDLPVSIDYRDVFNEIAEKHIRLVTKTNPIFPGHQSLSDLRLFV